MQTVFCKFASVPEGNPWDMLVDTQSEYQVRFDPLYAHWEELNFGDKNIAPLWTSGVISELFVMVFQVSLYVIITYMLALNAYQ